MAKKDVLEEIERKIDATHKREKDCPCYKEIKEILNLEIF
jgi:hypothetical protein